MNMASKISKDGFCANFYCVKIRSNKCCHSCYKYDKCEEKCLNTCDKCNLTTGKEVIRHADMVLINRIGKG